MKPEEEIERAYEELRAIIDGGSESFTHEDAVQYLKDKLAQPEQRSVSEHLEPVAWGNFKEDGTLVGLSQHPEDQSNWTGRKPLYTTPPQPAQPEQEPITKLFGTLPIYDEHEFRKGFIAGQRDAFNRLEERSEQEQCGHESCDCRLYCKKQQPEQEPVAWMSEHRFDELRKGFTVMTTLTKQRAFEDDVALYTTPPQPAQPEQEAVAWMHPSGGVVQRLITGFDRELYTIPLYTTPPQRTWVGLTDLENAKFVKTMERGNFLVAIYDIEKKLKELNT